MERKLRINNNLNREVCYSIYSNLTLKSTVDKIRNNQWSIVAK